MFELTRKVLSGTVLAAITGGVLLWGLSPGMTLKREYESYNGKPAGSEHTLQAITVPAYANVQGVTALEACTLQDGILVLAYPTCPYCRNLMPELLDAAEATDTSLYYCTLDKYRDVYTYDAAAGVPVLTTPAGEGYPELLVWLDEYTVDYTVTDSEGNALPVGEKRLGAPTIVQVRDGVPTSAWKLTSVADAKTQVEEYVMTNNKESFPDGKMDNIFRYVMPVKIFVPHDKEHGLAAILCNYRFDMEHGLAVLFENGTYKSVGSQDTVL